MYKMVIGGSSPQKTDWTSKIIKMCIKSRIGLSATPTVTGGMKMQTDSVEVIYIALT